MKEICLYNPLSNKNFGLDFSILTDRFGALNFEVVTVRSLLCWLLALFIISMPFSVPAAEPQMIEVDKATLIRIDRDAGVILIANPNIADVVLENKRLVFVLGRSEGETKLIVLDTQGEKILDLDVIVVQVAQRRIGQPPLVTIHSLAKERGVDISTVVCAPLCAPWPRVPRSQQGSSSGSGAATPAASVAATMRAIPSE